MISKYVNLSFPACSLIINILLFSAFFSKKKVKTIDNTSYAKLLTFGLLEAMFMFGTNLAVCFFFVPDNYYIFEILNKVLYSIYIIWMTILYVYIFKIGENKGYKYVKPILYIMDIALIIMIFISPIKLYYKDYLSNSYGQASNVLFLGCGLFLIMMSLTSIINFTKSKNRQKYIPLISLIVLMSLMMVIRKSDPLFNISSNILSFVELIMFFTIENPDLKMVNQLLRNKELVEEQIEDKSNFLFEISQSVKMPARNILELTRTYEKVESIIDKNDVVRTIGDNANELIFKTNNLLDVSSMDASKIKVVNEEYNINNLVNEIEALFKNRINNKNIDLNVNVSKNVPNRLFGDSVRLKQVIMSIMMNSLENMNKGYINLNIDGITRYDVVRVIIKIEDSGYGIPIEKINEILSNSNELDNEQIKKIEKLDVDLPVAIKIIKLLNGNINIRSVEDEGTTVDVVIDQLYKFDDLTEIDKQIERYSSDIYGRKRVLIVDDNKEELLKIKNYLNKYHLDINTSMIGKECIDRIRTGELYNLIIIDDELGNNSALNIYNKLQEMKVNVPIVVMLDKNKEHFKSKYKDDGFKEYILKENLKEELDRIINSEFSEYINNNK